MSIHKLSRNIDWVFLLCMVALTVFGIVMIYSASQTGTGSDTITRSYYIKQMVWLAVAAVVFIFTMMIPFKVVESLAPILYGISIVLLLVTLFFMPAIKGSHRWIVMGPLRLQPSELAKIATILMLAKVMGKRKVSINTSYYMKVFALVFVPLALIIKEPDLGSSLLFFVFTIPMLYWSGMELLHIFLLVSPILSIVASSSLPLWIIFFAILCAVVYFSKPQLWYAVTLFFINLTTGIVTPLLWEHLKPYQKERILSFVNPAHDPLGSGYQVTQAKIAVGSGELWGKGFLAGTQKKLEFLPEQHTDFIFSVIGEELGFVACALVLILFLILIFKSIRIAERTNNPVESLTIIGFVSVLLFQVLVNAGMNLGVMPVTGIPLPLISYGGSSLVFTFFILALILNIRLHLFD